MNGDEIILAQENVYLVSEIRDGFSVSLEGDPIPDGEIQVALIIVGFGALVLLLSVFDGERVEAEGFYQPAPVLLVGLYHVNPRHFARLRPVVQASLKITPGNVAIYFLAVANVYADHAMIVTVVAAIRIKPPYLEFGVHLVCRSALRTRPWILPRRVRSLIARTGTRA